MIEVEWTEKKCGGCKLPLRRAGNEVRCANTNCPGDPHPTSDTPALDALLEIDAMLERANQDFVKSVRDREKHR